MRPLGGSGTAALLVFPVLRFCTRSRAVLPATACHRNEHKPAAEMICRIAGPKRPWRGFAAADTEEALEELACSDPCPETSEREHHLGAEFPCDLGDRLRRGTQRGIMAGHQDPG
jgi:hypothetical protein